MIGVNCHVEEEGDPDPHDPETERGQIEALHRDCGARIARRQSTALAVCTVSGLLAWLHPGG